MSFDPNFLGQMFPDNPGGETWIDWSDSVGFTTLSLSLSIYIYIYIYSKVGNHSRG